MTTTYVNKNGSIEYCYKDSKQKCFDKNQTCSSRNAQTLCNVGWWWGYYWGAWWGWGGYWGVYGDNLRYLYTEIEAPDEYMCGYNRTCFTRVYCDDEISDGVCTFPRVAKCKTHRCVGDYNTYYYDACFTINGKDRESRCCAPPEDFKCEEGECDYSYEIVKKEYTVEYELVRSSYVCSERVKYPEEHCAVYGMGPYADTCFKYQFSCTPEEKCTTNPLCKEDTPPEGYDLEETEVGAYGYYWWWWWYNQGITWDYELDDCDCKCQPCVTCDDYDCNFAGYDNYYCDWGWGGYFGGIGTDCCGHPGYTGYYWNGCGWVGRLGICPEKKGDGSNKPWYCSTGDDCEQVDDTDENFDADNYVSGPYTSYSSCIQACVEDNKCIPPDRNYTRGLCCDTNFKKQMDNIKDSDCTEVGRSYKEKAEEVLCSSSGCSTGITRKYNKEMCTIDNSKFCKTTKVERTRSRKVYSYQPPIQDKAYARICNSCDPKANEECENDPLSKCPSNTEAIILKTKTTYHPEEVVDSTEAKLVVVFCKITTKKCKPSKEE